MCLQVTFSNSGLKVNFSISIRWCFFISPVTYSFKYFTISRESQPNECILIVCYTPVVNFFKSVFQAEKSIFKKIFGGRIKINWKVKEPFSACIKSHSGARFRSLLISVVRGCMQQVFIPRQMLMEPQNMPCWVLMLNFRVTMCEMTRKLGQKPKFAKHCNLLITYVRFHCENLFCHIQ